MKVEVSNDLWAVVAFTLRSDKALGSTYKRIVVYFRDALHMPSDFNNTVVLDKLIIDLQLGMRLSLAFTMNAEGNPLDLEQKVLRAELADGHMLPYGEALRDILDGDPLLSVRGESSESC